MLVAALLWALAAPQTAPDDDPVRVALYGRPEEPTIAEVAAAPAGHVGRAVRLRGRFQAVRGQGYRLCEQDHCLRLLPEEGLEVVLSARAAQWAGQDLQVTGVLVRERTPATAGQGEASFAVRFWRLTSRAPAERAP
ncbi:MAG TPA: hypothetical protein VFO85_13030, partial [Vicinamibacteria bacterium]|nr:hypothetical protein [Vicinamibacteria bacterium]